MMDPTTKHQKSIPENLVLHIYRQTNKNLNTAFVQLIAGTFFFGVRSYEYSVTPKDMTNAHAYFRKGVYILTENAAKFHTIVGSSI